MSRRTQSNKPLKWKDAAREKLMEIFSETIEAEAISGNFQMSSVEPVMKDVIQVGLYGLERRVRDIARTVVHLDDHGNSLPPTALKKELTDIETFTRRYTEEKLNAIKSGKVCEPMDGRGNEGVHLRALRACYPKLLRDMRVTSTNLLDDLVASDVISLASVSSIQAKPTNREKNEAVLRALQGLGHDRFLSVFLPALDKEGGNALLAHDIRATMGRLGGDDASTATGRGCQVCILRERVDLRRVADRLYAETLITREEFDDLQANRLSNKEAWDAINSRGNHKRNSITKVLRDKYPDVYEEMRKQNMGDLRCPCRPWNFAAQGNDDSDDAPDNSDIARVSDLYLVAPGIPDQRPFASMTSGIHSLPLASFSFGMASVPYSPRSSLSLSPLFSPLRDGPLVRMPDISSGILDEINIDLTGRSVNQEAEVSSSEGVSAFMTSKLPPPRSPRFSPY